LHDTSGERDNHFFTPRQRPGHIVAPVEPSFRPTMKRIRIIFAALAIVLLAPVSALAGKDRETTIMTYNIHHGVGADNVLDLKRIAELIRAHDVEVVGLQEVDRHFDARSEFRDQASRLARRLDMDYIYGANLDLEPFEPGRPRRQYGTAILSRYRILDHENTLLPKFEGSEQRGLLEALIKVRGVRLRIYNTHLQHNSPTPESGRAQRQLQVAAILAETAESAGRSHALVGDLNAEPDAPEMQPLLDRFEDAWTLAGEGEGFTLSSTNPTVRIDYILVSPGIDVAQALVPSSLASDHLPVVAELELPRRHER
jgi:endonuclease/exonuclease/phosphatase family metal-dependent hydrolase